MEPNERQLTERESLQAPPDLWWQCGIGCLIGCILGPLSVLACFFLMTAILPDEGEAFGPFGFIVAFILSIPTTGIICALFSPFIVRLFNKVTKGKYRS
jgi:hypothetical protein